MIVFGVLIALLFLFLFNNFYWKRKNLPPGPVPLPFLGNAMSFVGKEPPQKLIEWRKQYGDIYTYWLGDLAVVAINDLSTITEMFVKDGDLFAGRPINTTENHEMMKNGRTGVVPTDGEGWRDLRRFSLHTLRDFGFGRNLMQERILDEVVITLKSMKADREAVGKGQCQNVQTHIDIAVGSIIMQLIFGYKYTTSSDSRKEFTVFKAYIDEMMTIRGSFAGLVFQKHTHRYKHVPYVGSKYKRLMEINEQLFKMFNRNIERRRKEIDFEAHSESTDYTEAFLKKQYELEKKGQKSEVYTNEMLAGTLMDMWIAGQETTSNTLGWICIYLINKPEIQAKVQKELNAVIGSDRLVTNDDKPSLHYLNAVITESQRLCNLVPHNVFHRATRDVEVHGYTLLKDTVVVDQLSVVLYDPEIFPDPLTFKPERHLDENNNFKPHPAVIPFGVGKRSCLGESLARMELFLFAANIFNQFRLYSNKPIVEQRTMGLTVQPPFFQCHVDVRH